MHWKWFLFKVCLAIYVTLLEKLQGSKCSNALKEFQEITLPKSKE